jgi:hypothetical protein
MARALVAPRRGLALALVRVPLPAARRQVLHALLLVAARRQVLHALLLVAASPRARHVQGPLALAPLQAHCARALLEPERCARVPLALAHCALALLARLPSQCARTPLMAADLRVLELPLMAASRRAAAPLRLLRSARCKRNMSRC